MNGLWKKYLLYNLRSITLGTGLNAVIVGTLMSGGYGYWQSVPVGAFTAINLSFIADRLIFKQTKDDKFTRPPLPVATDSSELKLVSSKAPH